MFTLEAVITRIALVLNEIIPFLLLLGTVAFLWGMLKYITAGGDEQKTKDARNTMVYGVVGLALMVAVWGFVYLLLDFVFDNPDPAPIIPGPDIIKPL